MEKITGILIDVVNETAKVTTIDKCLDAYYRILNCDCIDIVRRRIGANKRRAAHYYEIVCDDEALLKEDPKISAIDDLGRPMLCGNLFITKFDGVDDIASLEPADILRLREFILPQMTRNHPKPYPMLHQCEYA